MLEKIQKLMEKQGEAKEFSTYLANLSLRHKPKRILMKLLEKV